MPTNPVIWIIPGIVAGWIIVAIAAHLWPRVVCWWRGHNLRRGWDHHYDEHGFHWCLRCRRRF